MSGWCFPWGVRYQLSKLQNLGHVEPSLHCHRRPQAGRPFSPAKLDCRHDFLIVAVRLLSANKPGVLSRVPIHKGVVSKALRGWDEATIQVSHETWVVRNMYFATAPAFGELQALRNALSCLLWRRERGYYKHAQLQLLHATATGEDCSFRYKRDDGQGLGIHKISITAGARSLTSAQASGGRCFVEYLPQHRHATVRSPPRCRRGRNARAVS